jgi:hypothetical protein
MELDPSVQGYMDWVTGIMQVNCTVEEYLEGFKTGNFPPNLLESILHESYHAIQIAMLGYLYRFAVTLHIIIRNSLPDHVNDYDELFEKLPAQISQSELYINIIRDLHRKGPNGLSVIDIVEGLTYCAQNRQSYDYDTERYVDFLRSSHMAEEYSRAFLHFHTEVGAVCDSVKAFPVAAHLALCSHSPPECFSILVKAYRDRVITLKTNLPEIIKFCQDNDSDYGGFSWEFPDAFGQPFPYHNAFGPIRDFFFEHPEGSDIFTKFLLSPELLDAQTQIDMAVDIVMFKPRPDPANPDYREWLGLMFKNKNLPEEEKLSRIDGVKLMSAISRRLMGTVSVPLS